MAGLPLVTVWSEDWFVIVGGLKQLTEEHPASWNTEKKVSSPNIRRTTLLNSSSTLIHGQQPSPRSLKQAEHEAFTRQNSLAFGNGNLGKHPTLGKPQQSRAIEREDRQD